MNRKLLCLAFTIAFTTSFAQNEFVVNTRQDSTQRDPQVERDATGNVVVVWTSIDHAGPSSQGDILLQRFDPAGVRIGQEALVNTAASGNQEKPAAAMNSIGTMVVAWASFASIDSSYDIRARLYQSGVPAGPEFAVNTTWALAQTEPDVDVDGNGNAIIVWDSWDQDGGDRGVYGRLFNANGTPATGEFLVNVTTAYSQARPAVKFFADGRFVVVWESWKQDEAVPAGYGVYGRLFQANGTPASDEFRVNTTLHDYQWLADVETFNDNSFVVSWCSWYQDGSDGAIVLQRFSSIGQPLGGEVLVNQTTANYQWLPRIRRLSGGGFVVVWSSWKQDGSREGVYMRTFDSSAAPTSFETQVNTTTESFQWEPDVIGLPGNELLVVWSSWGQTGHDYEIVGRHMTFSKPQGYLDPGIIAHPAGRSTSRVVVHVTDSLALTGHSYEVTFDSLGARTSQAWVRDVVTGDTLVRGFPLSRGEEVFYLTPSFHGVAVEIVPEFDLDLNVAGSAAVNSLRNSVISRLGLPTAGVKLLAPIDVALIWGSLDTLGNGRWSAPLDTAIGTTGVREIATPFLGRNLTDNEKMDLLVVETSGGRNQRWDLGERIVFRTPVRYRTVANNTHAEVTPSASPADYLSVGVGDTNVVLTTRPIGVGERYTFATNRASILDAGPTGGVPGTFVLHQNYPNPFNPSTVVSFQLPVVSEVRLRVYDLLGREVATLLNDRKEPGTYHIPFDAAGLASGVYFYRLQAGGRSMVSKMMVVR